MQLVQTLEALPAEYLPAKQLVQAEDPAKAAYVPATQPAQVEGAEAPVAFENLPATQCSHVVAPAAAENFPASHSLQAEAPAAEYSPTPHCTHSLEEAFAPSVKSYLYPTRGPSLCVYTRVHACAQFSRTRHR